MQAVLYWYIVYRYKRLFLNQGWYAARRHRVTGPVDARHFLRKLTVRTKAIETNCLYVLFCSTY